MVMILLCIYPQTTGLLLSTLGNLSAMVDFGDSRDDAESLLQDLKEFAEKSVVSSLLKDLFFTMYFFSWMNFLKLFFNGVSTHFNFTDCMIKLMISSLYCALH